MHRACPQPATAVPATAAHALRPSALRSAAHRKFSTTFCRSSTSSHISARHSSMRSLRTAFHTSACTRPLSPNGLCFSANLHWRTCLCTSSSPRRTISFWPNLTPPPQSLRQSVAATRARPPLARQSHAGWVVWFIIGTCEARHNARLVAWVVARSVTHTRRSGSRNLRTDSTAHCIPANARARSQDEHQYHAARPGFERLRRYVPIRERHLAPRAMHRQDLVHDELLRLEDLCLQSQGQRWCSEHWRAQTTVRTAAVLRPPPPSS
jgi:hypothetical protein